MRRGAWRRWRPTGRSTTRFSEAVPPAMCRVCERPRNCLPCSSRRSSGPDFRGGRGRARKRPRGGAEPRLLGAHAWRTVGTDRYDDRPRRGALHHRRDHAASVRVPDEHQCRALDTAGVQPGRPARSVALRALASLHARGPLSQRAREKPGRCLQHPARLAPVLSRSWPTCPAT